MQLVATKSTGKFFRAQTIIEDERLEAQAVMESDAGQKLNFQVMTDEEFERWLATQ